MSNDYPTRIDLCDGKYTLIYDFQTGQSECLHYGEPWRQLVGDKMVLACFDKIVELQQQRDELVAALTEIAWSNDTFWQTDRANAALAKLGADKTGEVVDPSCTCDEHGACAYCWNGKKHDAYSDGMTPRDDQEFLSKTDGLDGPVEGLQANQDCGTRYVE